MDKHKNYHVPYRLTETDRAIIDLEIEKSKLNREKSMLVLNKSLMLYFVFLFLGITGVVNGYIGKTLFNILILMGLAVLVLGIVPYIRTMKAEDKNIDDMIQQLKNRRQE